MKFLKQFDYPEELKNNFIDVFMLKTPKEYLDQLKPHKMQAKNRANTYMEGNSNNNKGKHNHLCIIYVESNLKRNSLFNNQNNNTNANKRNSIQLSAEKKK